ncbi:CTP synthase [Candidatus Dojkabacteria bacterium]|uniref:CTP synthase (glutamine hydrolyzing) n=1 Tax=Candidatus Dojkabacteria bacterium TaxID=2099670 RepID=A0A955L0Q1_9BACT|nr:CTP synthase [Candidatus Dojkabacteria bacterium]
MSIKAKYIFVSGGVMSAVGKGVTSASISLLLKAHGYTVCPIKCENNLNVDFGTINPIEHGDPFLCFDGLEADIDLGNYERFLNQEVGQKNFMTMGQLYSTVISNERKMKYEGEDVEPIPHVVNEIISRIKLAAEESQADFVVIELGGTVGEYENNNGLYYEAARILSFTEQVANVHVTYVPVPPHIDEPKTKPAQFGLKALMSMGINPNFIVIRSERPVDKQRKYKFGLKFYVDHKDIFSCENLKNVYQVPVHLYNQELDKRLLNYFGITPKKKSLDLSFWEDYSNKLLKKFDKEATIAIVGKYFATGDSSLVDSYYALLEAINHARVFNKMNVALKFINSDKQEKNLLEQLKGVDGIVVPIGWGERGTKGKIKAIKYARENKIPYLGLCYGMQLACVEYARNVLKIKDANSEEIDPKTKNPIIHSIPFNEKYQVIKGEGTSMRLGTFDCIVKKNTLTHEIYSKHNGFKDTNKSIIAERHRHRFEFNNKYREQFEKDGFIFSGTSPDNFFVEFIELPKKTHPFFVATQGHPEYKSSPQEPHPVFIKFLLKAGD